MKTKGYLTCFTLVTGLLLSGCSSNQAAAPKIPPPVSVVVTQPVQKDVPIFIEAIGNVFADTSVEIRPQVSGKLLEFKVKEGQMVKKGDLLFTIDPRPYEASLALAEATLNKDKATLEFSKKRMERNTELVQKEFIAQLTFEQITSDVSVNEAQTQIDIANVDLAKINRDYAYVKSPIDGRLGNRRIDPGNLLIANDPNPVINVSQMDPVQIRFNVPQSQFWDIQKALQAGTLSLDITLPQDPDHIFKGSLYFLDNTIDLGTGTVLLKGHVPNENMILWPGEFVRVRVNLRMKEGAILLPTQAVQTGQQGKYVFVVKPDDTVELRQVKVSEIIDNQIVVEEGISMGETVVQTGQLNLKNGSKVKIQKTDTSKVPKTAPDESSKVKGRSSG